MALNREQIAATVGPTWVDFFAPFIQSERFDSILATLRAEKAAGKIIYPDPSMLFTAFQKVALPDVRVVIVGQDPYPVGNYAMGSAFAHPKELPLAPSLGIMLDGIEQDAYNGLNLDKPGFDTTLSHWQQQGVLLLNTALTVVASTPNSHKELWRPFIDYTIDMFNRTRRSLIFLAWGSNAKEVCKVDPINHFMFGTEHPAAAGHENRAWKHNNHFSITNTVITGNRLGDPIKW